MIKLISAFFYDLGHTENKKGKRPRLLPARQAFWLLGVAFEWEG